MRRLLFLLFTLTHPSSKPLEKERNDFFPKKKKLKRQSFILKTRGNVFKKQVNENFIVDETGHTGNPTVKFI